MDTRTPTEQVVAAVLYAMKCGCFFPVPLPQAGATVEELTQWGAMRHLHDAVAALPKEERYGGKR